MVDSKLITFITLVEEKNYTRTAEKLYITQPAVTHHIKAIEKEYDIQLFSNPKTFELTKPGMMLLEYANSARLQEKLLINSIRNQSQDTLNIGVTPFALDPLTYRVFDKLTKNLVNFNLVCKSSDRLFQLLLSGEIDFIIIDSSYDSSSYNSLFLFSEKIVLAAKSEGAYKEHTKLTRDMLQQAIIAMPDEGSGLYNTTMETLKHKNIRLKSNTILHSNTITGINSLIRVNDAVSFIYEDALKGDPNIKKLDFANFSPSQNFYLLYNKFSEADSKAVRFIDSIKKLGIA